MARDRGTRAGIVGVITSVALFAFAALGACGHAKAPPPPRVEYDAAPPPVVDAAPPDIPEASPPEDAAAKAKTYALCIPRWLNFRFNELARERGWNTITPPEQVDLAAWRSVG